MKCLLFGTGPFAVPAFKFLIESEHEVLGLVTRPVEDSGKRRKSSENPTRDLGLAKALPIFAPTNVNSAESMDWLNQQQADLHIVCDYGQILSNDCLATARLGGINLHGSLLPKYRGAAPIQWAIYQGETETGVSVIHMTPKLDGGPILASASLSISPEETAETLEPRLAQLGIDPVLKAIELLATWDRRSQIGSIQDPKLASLAPRLKKSDGEINWQAPANQIFNQIRAFQPWPSSYTTLTDPTLKQPLRLIIQKAKPVSAVEIRPTEMLDPQASLPGTIIQCDKQQLVCQTGNGGLSILEIQPAGKKTMAITEFLRGQRLSVGMRLGLWSI